MIPTVIGWPSAMSAMPNASGPITQPRADLLATMWIFAGSAYPLWSLLAPSGTRDPLWAWCAIGAAYLATGLAVRLRAPGPRPRWVYLPAFAVAIHQHALFTLNPDHTFYAVAAVMAVFTSIPMLEDRATILVYSALVVGLSGFQAFTNGSNAVFLSSGIAWVVLLTNRYMRLQAADRDVAELKLRDAHDELAHEKAERIRLEDELEVAQRMDSLGRLAGAFAHEFNNQLMAIRIHAELMQRSLPQNAPQRGDLEQIHQTTNSAADLTSRLLAFSRPNRVREEPGELCAVASRSLVTLRHLMSEKTPVSISVPPYEIHVPVGAKQLGQLLLNLALNARDAMPNGGTLAVKVARIARREVELPVDIPGETLAVLTVTDSGVGMSAAVRDRLFEPFFTTKAERGNSGLGLSVVYGVVKETGGHIRVTSEPGNGARFDIYWPEVAPAAPLVTAPAIQQGAPARARVLLVEDQPALRDGLARWLGDHGFAVVSCESGEEALARARDFDVIASDVVLRGMDGIELLSRLRRAAPELPAVLFSGHLDHLSTQRRAIPDGVMFLEKPFAPEALLTTLDSLVAPARGARGSMPA